MHRKICGCFTLIGLITGLILLTGPVPVSAQVKKKDEKMAVEKAAAQAAPYNAPEIRRIAVFQDQGGEIILRSPLSLVRDHTNGDLIVSSFEAGEVVILDKSGSLVKRLGAETGLVSPYGVALDAKGLLYVGEVRTGLLKVFSPIGSLLDEFDLSEIMGKTVSPGRIVLGKDGFLYIVDLTNNEILIFDLKGKFVRSVGKFDYLQKGGPAGDGTIVGLSAMGKAVTIFGRDGELLHSFGQHGDSPEINFSFPTGYAVDARKRLWIADAFQHRLKVFSLDGKFLFNFGKMEEATGGFFFPVDIYFTETGELIVLEKGASRIQVFQVDDLKDHGHRK